MTALAREAGRGIRVQVCELADLTAELGVAALVGSEQVAIFLLADGTVVAVSNVCPFSGAAVLSRGITGSRGDVPTVASPLHKQVFSLLDGRCLDSMDRDPLPGRGPDLETYRVTVDDGRVIIDVPGSS